MAFTPHKRPIFPLLLLALTAAACDDRKPENLAPVASALEPTKPAAPQAMSFAVVRASSKVSFLMEAPIEKISGEAPEALEGELFVNLADLAKSTGLVKVDLDKLVLYQERRDDEKGAFGERKKNETQNGHARTWLEISPDTPEEARKANRFAEFRVNRLENPSAPSALALPGSERKVSATAVGDFRLHGRKSEKRAKLELTFQFAGEKPELVRVRTLEPLPIGLEEFDVRPREAFGKLAQKTLGALGSKVATAAPLEIEFTARPK
jgi:hypothetical protein